MDALLLRRVLIRKCPVFSENTDNSECVSFDNTTHLRAMTKWGINYVYCAVRRREVRVLALNL